MPIPEISDEVRSKARDMGHEEAVAYVWREAWDDCSSLYEQDLYRVVGRAEADGSKVVSIAAVLQIGTVRSDG